ncbi:hypothetical protein ACIBHY_46870 [Nonomuraea sp. NPDC050547]|uniref:hypothetical protein n=1 Tax=Nonomuraea sp. NPDC050547 TaxID=3364368 RepID=UPI0037BD5808
MAKMSVSKEFLRLLRRREEYAPARKMFAEAYGPDPSPTLAKMVTEANAAYILNRVMFAEDRKEAMAEVSGYLTEIVDDWCGTPPKIKFPPIPWPISGLPSLSRPTLVEIRKMRLEPADYVEAAIVYQAVSDDLAGEAPELADQVSAMAQEMAAFGTSHIDICVHVVV